MAVGEWFHAVFIVTAFIGSIVRMVGLAQLSGSYKNCRLHASGFERLGGFYMFKLRLGKRLPGANRMLDAQVKDE